MVQPNLPTPQLPLAQFRFIFSPPPALQLPNYPGSAWRGAFGNALKKTVCVIRNTPCKACLFNTSCAYSYIFETPPPPHTEKMRKYNAAPHPFIFKFPLEPTNLDLYYFDMTLFGHGLRYFPYIIHALNQAGNTGIGGKRQVFKLQRIEQLDLESQTSIIYQDGQLLNPATAHRIPVPTMPERLTITLQSPLRLQEQGKNLNQTRLSFAAFFSHLLRRISLLTYFHTDTPLETDFIGLTQQAQAIAFLNMALDWQDWTRYSSRQATEMQMGGVVGTLTLEMTGLEDFWPYLWLGQWTHVGKATSMGLGAYRIT